jgi:hypothetical protein
VAGSGASTDPITSRQKRNRPFRTPVQSSANPWLNDYAISKGPDVGDILDSVELVEAFARDHGSGRYNVDEHSLDPFPGLKVTARAWGKVIPHKDGQLVLDPSPWQ